MPLPEPRRSIPLKRTPPRRLGKRLKNDSIHCDTTNTRSTGKQPQADEHFLPTTLMWPSLARMALSFAVLGSLRSSLTRAFTPTTRGAFSSRAVFTTSRAAAQVGVGTPPTAFDDGQRPYQITTPIYYVNDKPHIGHAYTSTGKCSRTSPFSRVAYVWTHSQSLFPPRDVSL